MNKKFYFGLALTAGLFASCSSYDLVGESASSQAFIDNGAPAKIEIALTPGYEITRGTGVVGDVGGAANAQWAGQEFHVLMLEKGTMLGARTTPTDASTAIFKGAPFTATNTAVIALDDDAVFYPVVKQDGTSTGVYDFWGYRLDDAATTNPETFNGYDAAAAAASPATCDATVSYADAATYATAKGAAAEEIVADQAAAEASAAAKTATGTYYYKTSADDAWWSINVTNPATAAAGNQITVPFEIDGTQDLMVAATTPSATYDDEYLYSAKSSRNGIKPTMAFKHLLTSLTFKVKPKSEDISDKATNPTTSAQWKPGYQIANIQVKSKATGELVVAYTGAAEPERIIWDAAQDWATPGTLATFELQCRKKNVDDPAQIEMVQIDKNITTNLPYPTAGYKDMNGGTQFTYTTAAARDAFEVYDRIDTDPETGLPTGNKTTLGAITGTYGYILTYKADADRLDGSKYYTCKYEATDMGPTSKLVPYATHSVDPVVLSWAGTNEVPVVVTDEAASDATEFAAAAADHKYTYDGTTNKLTLADWKNTLAVDATNFYIYFDGNTTYTKFKVATAYAPAVATAGEANAVVSPVGVPMLVAPSNDAANSGYEVIVTYKYWKKTSASTVAWTTASTQPIKVSNYQTVGGVKQPRAFEAGKNYNVTITLYSDGEVLNGEATSKPWEDGGDLDAGDDN